MKYTIYIYIKCSEIKLPAKSTTKEYQRNALELQKRKLSQKKRLLEGSTRGELDRLYLVYCLFCFVLTGENAIGGKDSQ